MPSGKGTYGTKKGRPPNKNKKKEVEMTLAEARKVGLTGPRKNTRVSGITKKKLKEIEEDAKRRFAEKLMMELW
tara:strand:+ start:226 stop:447 length:222 start_codon:yes stop_codon:yes gene_type:complete